MMYVLFARAMRLSWHHRDQPVQGKAGRLDVRWVDIGFHTKTNLTHWRISWGL